MVSLTATVSPAHRLAEFEERLRESQRLVYQIAFGVLSNAADAEEITQDVFLRAYRKLSSLREPGKFRAWVARMSWRLAINRQRASARALRRDTAWFESAMPPSLGAETLASRREFHARLREEIDRLPEKLRAALLLSAVDGLDARTVSAILEIPEGTVRSRLHLARKQLLRRFST